MPAHTLRSTTAACVATVLGVPTADVPLGEEELRAWLGERGMGMVPVSEARGFSWAGPWIAVRPSADDGEPRAVVMFGVPSGAIWDPAGTTEEVLSGVVVCPLDPSVWEPPQARDPGRGVVEDIVIAPAREGRVRSVASARAVPDRGLEGDRYEAGGGTFASGRPGSALTLIEATVLDELGPIDHRRNLVIRGTDLNALVGRRFRVGEVLCAGRRLCEPCLHLERLNEASVLRPLVHRGGLRADIVEGGTIHVADVLLPL